MLMPPESALTHFLMTRMVIDRAVRIEHRLIEFPNVGAMRT